MAAGSYHLRFHAFPGGEDLPSNVAVTTVGQTEATCAPVDHLPSPANVDVVVSCRDLAGAPADTAFTLLVASDEGLSAASAFVTSGGPGPLPTPDTVSTWTAGPLPLTIDSAAPGVWDVRFGTGNVASSAKLVTTVSSAPRMSCVYGEGISGGLRVRCYDGTGAPAEVDMAGAPVRFATMQVARIDADRPLGFALAHLTTAASYTPEASTSYNSAGGAITATRSAPGRYAMRFAGLTPAPGREGHLQITPVGNQWMSCKAVSWLADAGDLVVSVECRNLSGQLADSRYGVLFLD
jgi:hypothetical protein